MLAGLLLFALPTLAQEPAGPAPVVERDIFLKHEKGGAYAIPKTIVTAKGTLLVAAQDRAGGDWGKPIDPVLVRSEDGGRTWSAPLALSTDTESPRRFHVKPTAMVEDRVRGRILVFLVRSPLKNAKGEVVNEIWFYENLQETRRLGRAWHLIESTDDGRTWSEPRDVTGELMVRPHWQEWSPVDAGIQLREGPHAGRLVVPVRAYCPDVDPSEHDLAFQTNSVIFSDDGGRTWNAGERCEPRHGETSIVELSGGVVYLNHRRSRGTGNLRDYSLSLDGGESFSEHGVHEDLPDQRCHAGLARVRLSAGGELLAFSNVPGPKREGLVLSVSSDGGGTWRRAALLEPGPAAYSNLVQLPGADLVCVYETGEGTSRQHLAVARIAAVSLTPASVGEAR